MSDEEEFIPFQAARKLNMIFLHNEVLRNDKELQDKIISWSLEMLSEAKQEWSELRKDILNSVIKVHQRTNASKGGVERDKKYKQFREKFATIQKEYFIKANQNGQKLTANSFVDWFLTNKAKEMAIPYIKHNQKNKLRQLAQANNRKFKKAFAC